MKPLALFLCIVGALLAQVAPRGEITPDTVVARVAGHEVTAGEMQKIMRNWNPSQMQIFQNNPMAALQQIFTFKYLAQEAEKKHLADEEPWRSQIEYLREGVMGQAEANYERNTFPVSEQDMESFYAANKAKFEQSKIKIIKIGFKEPLPVGSSKEAISQAAAVVVQNEHAPNRTEAAAKTLASDVIKQARGGADFAVLAKKYSDDEDSKEKGGDYGTVGPTSPYPDEMKKAVFALKPNEVSEPVRQPNALYIIRVEERTAPPIDKVHAEIINEIRDNHLRALNLELAKKFAPTILKPEFFLSAGDAAQKK